MNAALTAAPDDATIASMIPALPAGDPRVGSVFEGRYRIDGVLGRGGFGVVYRAMQLGIERPVALKILGTKLAAQPDEVARFVQEARIIGALDHPHIVKLVELGRAADGAVFLAMELLVGESLARRVRRDGPLPEVEVLRLGRQILEALAEAHASGVVHRDLKLENLFLAEHPRRGVTLKLLDFGIAKVTNPGANLAAGAAPLTRAGVVVGSPRVMAPEQICGDPITPQTDLYALGCVLYELLTGRPPFVCQNTGAYARAHLLETPRWPTRAGRALTGPLAELILQCLEKRPADRPPSADALLAVWPDATPESALAPAAPPEPQPIPPSGAAYAPPDAPLVPRAAPTPTPIPGPLPSHAARHPPHRARRWPLAMATLVALAALVGALWSVR